MVKKDIPSLKNNSQKINSGETILYPFEAGDGQLGTLRSKSPRINTKLGKMSLTEKQNKIVQFIQDHINQLQFPPTIREIASYFNISVKASHDHLKAISKKGYVRLLPGSARGIEIVHRHDDGEEMEKFDIKQFMNDIVLVPILGTIAAGTPILAEENFETKIAMPRSFLPKSGDMFALKVRGDSMEGAGIYDGDIAVIKQIQSPSELKNGDIVAALIDGEATLKTWEKNGNQIMLKPDNERYKPIYLTSTSQNIISGKLVGIYRKYEK